MPTKFTDYLRDLRDKRDESLRQAAKGIGISAMYLSQLECGKADNPSGEVIRKIADYYNVSTEELRYNLLQSLNTDDDEEKFEAARKILSMDGKSFRDFLNIAKDRGVL